jgi:hypothetical protein
MKLPVTLQPDERVVYSSVRSGTAHHSAWWWLAAVVGGLQVCNAPMWIVFYVARTDSTSSAASGFPFFTVAESILVIVLLVRWLDLRFRPAYLVTNQRILVRRILQPVLAIDPADVTGSARFLVKYSRYGQIVRETLTQTVVIGLRSGSPKRIGPVNDADTLVSLFNGLAQGEIDLRALPGVNGELAAAETRRDLFFARSTRASDVERGPLFVGPGTMIGFAAELLTSQMLQLYTIVGAPRSAEEIEERLIALAASATFGRAVVMKREGTTLTLEKRSLVLAGEDRKVAFDLTPEDARRAEAWLPKNEAHPYR